MIFNRQVRKTKIFLLDGNFKVPYENCAGLSELYHENSKLGRSDVRPWLAHLMPSKLKFMPLKTFFARARMSYKIYPSAKTIELAQPDEAGPGSLWEVIRSRRSGRDYGPAPVTAKDLANLLFHSYGETGRAHAGEGAQKLRAVPSAGALYPLDIYVLAENVSDVPVGLYHYNVKSHSLELLKAGLQIRQIYQSIQPENNDWILNAACVLLVTATFGRNQIKYGERGYRGVLFDAGHLSQNIQLSAQYLNYAACMSMACLDDEVNDFLGVDGVEESILFSVMIGAHNE